MKNDSSVVDDKFHVRDELDLSTALWRRLGDDPEGASGTVEYAFVAHRDAATYVVLREAADPDGTVLVFTPSEWDAFLLGARAGEFDRPH
ncbi:DUF397 domain-containing protein [Saccharomonospora xinjiangensis]|uniref:DUF397 domain-containing protein n=1 Tax=Saccharomonospora xinjiangensis XJ-54 TaxID=882086 RepID=I0UZP3_9PSEU|nr:DUF397 domain-containing protein [Saccharomonospora xinjiangensis]EID53346.1 protein of unknown function (DUF397) [Saccharomonospora xinjiangensis XJ-54]